MIRRVVTVSQRHTLRVRDNALLLIRDGREVARVPLEDLGILILESAEIDLSVSLLSALAVNDCAVAVCGPNHLPCAYQLPYPGHGLHPQILRGQMAATLPTKKRLWACLIQTKIRNAAVACRQLEKKDGGLMEMAKRVKSGDPGNVEAQAATVAFQALFGSAFRRDADGAGRNSMLNYGYAIVRAAVARAAAGAGLHLALGIWHRNRSDAYALADDMMEPLRPLVDRQVASMPEPEDEYADLKPTVKRELIGILAQTVVWKNRKTPLLTALELYAAAFRDALIENKKETPCPLL